MTIRQFIRDDYPFRPAAGYSGDSFGFRKQSSIGSPLHPGQDRSGNPDHIVMPFDGKLSWNLKPGTAWGSCARIVPDADVHCEIQIAHTIRHDRSRAAIHNYSYNQGDALPIVAGDIGLSAGAHTHTELVVENTAKHYAYFRTEGGLIYADGAIQNDTIIRKHCFRYNLSYAHVIQRLLEQIHTWGISEIWEHFIIRNALPDYRTPHWGYGSVIIADTRRYLEL